MHFIEGFTTNRVLKSVLKPQFGLQGFKLAFQILRQISMCKNKVRTRFEPKVTEMRGTQKFLRKENVIQLLLTRVCVYVRAG